jgi:hypothetical protein
LDQFTRTRSSFVRETAIRESALTQAS